MRFGNMDTHKIRRLDSYEQALTLYTSRPPLRKKTDPHIKAWGKDTQKYLWMWQDTDGSIVLHQHATDIMWYRPDGSIELAPYRSTSTDTLVNITLPQGIAVDYEHPCTNNGILGLAEKPDIDHSRYKWHAMQEYTAYRLSPHVGSDRRVVLRKEDDGRWRVANPEATLIPFKIPRVQVPVAKAAYAAYRIADFQAWSAGMLALTTVETARNPSLVSPESRLEALADPESWLTLLQHIGFEKSPYMRKKTMPSMNAIMDRVREDIRRCTPEAIRYDTPMGVPWGQLESIRKAQNSYCHGGQP